MEVMAVLEEEALSLLLFAWIALLTSPVDEFSVPIRGSMVALWALQIAICFRVASVEVLQAA